MGTFNDPDAPTDAQQARESDRANDAPPDLSAPEDASQDATAADVPSDTAADELTLSAPGPGGFVSVVDTPDQPGSAPGAALPPKDDEE